MTNSGLTALSPPDSVRTIAGQTLGNCRQDDISQLPCPDFTNLSREWNDKPVPAAQDDEKKLQDHSRSACLFVPAAGLSTGRIAGAVADSGAQLPLAEDYSVARIDHTFPPPADTRRPDRTIPNVEAGTGTIITCSPDGRILLTAGGDKIIRVWGSRTGELMRALNGHTGRIWSIAFSADGKTLASVSEDRTVKTREFSSGRLLRSTAVKFAVPSAVF
jgi:WD40 repeat protein